MKIKKIFFVLLSILLFFSFLITTKNDKDIFSGDYFFAAVFIFSLVLILRFSGSSKRISIFLASILAIFCVNVFVLNNYQLVYGADLLLPTIFTSFGAGMLVLWLDNTKAGQFLVSGLLLVLLGLNLATLLQGTFVIVWLTYIIGTVKLAWPLFLLILGIGSLLKAQKIKKSISQVQE